MKIMKTFTGSEITLEHVQIKSTKKAKKLARALNIIEIECGIQSVAFRLVNSFVCPDVDISKLNKTPMEKTLRRLIKSYRKSISK